MRTLILATLVGMIGQFIYAPPCLAINVWDGGGGDAAWGTAGNWDAGNTLPGFVGSENVDIGTSFASGTTMTLDVNRFINSLTYSTSTSTVLNSGTPGGMLILNNGGISRGNLSGSQTINAPIEIRGSATWTQNGAGGSVMRITGVISEDAPGSKITIAGNRLMRLDNANSFSGGLQVNAGVTLQIGNANAAGSGTFTLGSSTTTAANLQTMSTMSIPNVVSLAGNLSFNASSFGANFTNAVTLTGTRNIEVLQNSSETIIFSGGIGDGGNGHGLTISGSRNIRLSGNDTYTGPTTATGTQVNLQLNGTRQTSGITLNGSILTLQGDNVLGNGTLTFNSGGLNSTGGARIVNNAVSMGGTLGISTTLSGLVTFNQQITLNDDLEVVGSHGASDTVAPVFAGGFNDGGNGYSLTLRGSQNRRFFLGGPSSYTGGTFITDTTGPIDVRIQGGPNRLPTNGLLSVVDTATAGTASVQFLGGHVQTIGSLTGNGPINLNSSPLTISGPGTQTYSGNLSGSGSVTIDGTVVQTFATVNSYTGGTTVSGGALLVTNSSGSATGSGTVNVTGGTLGGTGLIGGGLNATDGIVSPGLSTGILTIGGASTLGGTSTLVMEVGGLTPGTGGLGFHDQLVINNTLNITGDAMLDVSLIAGFEPTEFDSVTLITTTGNITGEFANAPEGWLNLGQYLAQITYNSNSVVLSNFSYVPEPGSGLLLLTALALVSPRISRRRN